MFANQPPQLVCIRTLTGPGLPFPSTPPQGRWGDEFVVAISRQRSAFSQNLQTVVGRLSFVVSERLPTIDYLLLNWKRLRAPFCPYFLRSLARGSRVTMPSALSFPRSSALNSISARVIPRRTASACPATPPPHTLASTLKVAALSVDTSGRFAAMRCEGVTKYSSNALPLTLNSPLPGRRKTRAIAILRRPVP